MAISSFNDPYFERHRIEEEMRYREQKAYERAKMEAMQAMQYGQLGTTISSAALGLGQIQGAAEAPVVKKPNPVILLLEDL